MKPIFNQTIITVGLIIGAGLWLVSAKNLERKGKLDYTPNVATIKGSPYGKVLALAMQGPIDFYSHQGYTHADAAFYNSETLGTHECSAGCDDHGHDHAPHTSATDDSSKHAHGEPELVRTDISPWHVRVKGKIDELVAYTHRRTNGGNLTKQHELYLQEATEDKLKFAYELDPSNFINYGNYEYFLSNTNLGRNVIDEEKNLALSRSTIDFCKKDSHDPSSWVTASMAAYDMADHMAGNLERYSLSDVRSSLGEFDFYMQRYGELLGSYHVSGMPLSAAKAEELIEQARQLTYLRKSFDVYLKRLNSVSN